jgi:hypothetical protein
LLVEGKSIPAQQILRPGDRLAEGL